MEVQLVKPLMKIKDVHLEELCCSHCHKYLSVFPIKIYSNSEIKCGRCNKDDDDGIVSLYQIIAENYLFKCVNRYEGCEVLLKPKEVFIHEKNCVGSNFTCPKCEDDIERSVLDLIWHYKLKHPSSYLKNNFFQCKLLNNDMLLYVQNDVVFFVKYDYISSFKKLYMTVVTLTKVDAVQTFTVIANSIAKETKMKNCSILNSAPTDSFEIDLSDVISIDLVKVFFVIEILKNFERIKKLQNNSTYVLCMPQSKSDVQFSYAVKIAEKIKLCIEQGEAILFACSNCFNYVGPEIYICTEQEHLLCNECKWWCGRCTYNGLNEKFIFFDSTKRAQFLCKYCCKVYSDMLEHIRNGCKTNGMYCWYCHKHFDKDMVESHVNNHDGTFSKKSDLSDLLLFTEQNGNYFVLLNSWRLVCVKWCKIKDNLFEITTKKLALGWQLYLLTENKAYPIDEESPLKFNPKDNHKLQLIWFWLHKT